MSLKSTTVQRFDVGTSLSQFERNGAGGLKLPVRLARTGIQVYRDAKGDQIREYRSPEEVFNADSLASLSTVPVTIGHPTGGVSPSTWKLHSVGHVSEMPTQRIKLDGAEWIESQALVTDANAISQVASDDLREVSMGYEANVVMQDGVSPEGEHYDAIQTDIRYNHLALLPRGRARAGREARLTIDGHQDCPQESSDMKVDSSGAQVEPVKVVVHMVTLDSVEYERGSDLHVKALNAKLDAADKALAKSDAEVAELKVDAKKLKADANDTSTLDARIEFRDSARKLLGDDYDFKGQSDSDVRKAAVCKVDSDFDATGKSDTYIECRFDMAVEKYSKPSQAKADEASDYLNVKKIDENDHVARRNSGFAASFGGK